MEKDGGVKRWAVICYVVLLLANYQAAAMSFQECYGACFLLCAIIPTNSLFTCTFRCLQDCIIPPSNPLDAAAAAAAPTTTTATTQIFYFCKLGCALYSCSNLSSRQDPREKEVAGCVDSCSEMCTK